MLNRVILMGRITADPELKTTNTGVSGYNQSYGSNQSYGAPSYGGNQAYHQEPAQQAPASYQSGSNSDFQDMPLDDDLPF